MLSFMHILNRNQFSIFDITLHVIDVAHIFQVKIQKDCEVRLKIIGTRVDATEIVRT